MQTKKKELIPTGAIAIESPETEETKRYLAVIRDNYWKTGTLEEIKHWILDNHGVDEEVELTELMGNSRKTKLNISLKF